MVAVVRQVTALFTDEFVMDTAEGDVCLQVIGADGALLPLAVARCSLLLARLAFFSNINGRGSYWLRLVLVRLLVDLGNIRRTLGQTGHVNAVAPVLDDVLVV